MANINSPIPYQWRLGWGEGVGGQPIVTPLLKAVIEKNLPEMERLAAQGASLKASDKTTLRRILFHVADCYPVMEWLVKHGVSRIGHDLDVNGNNGINDAQCLSPAGYSWGLTARAYYLKAYDVMDLLAAHGFDNFTCYDLGWDEAWEADDHILRKGDAKGLKVLLENGYVFQDFPFYRKYYELYVLGRAQVRRRTIGLDHCKFSKSVPSPRYEDEPLIFGRKEAKARNARRREDYEDRARAHREFVQAYGSGNLDDYLKEKADFDKLFVQATQALMRDGKL